MLELIKTRRGFLMLIPLAMIGLLVTGGFSLFKLKDNLLEDRRNQVRAQVETASGIPWFFYERFRAGEIGEEEARQGALTAIQTLRYGQNEYFWVNDLQGRVLMHPAKPELSGQDVNVAKDPAGKAIFREFIQVANNSGSGFVDYSWAKPGHEAPVPKVSYVQLFQPWGWVVGSGAYLDDIEAEFQQWAVYLLLLALVGIVLLTAVAWAIVRQRGAELAIGMARIRA